MLVWGKSLKRRPLPHAPIPLKPFAILSNELVQNTGQATFSLRFSVTDLKSHG